jgi:hypothetical protein
MKNEGDGRRRKKRKKIGVAHAECIEVEWNVEEESVKIWPSSLG